MTLIINRINCAKFIELSDDIPIVDVRTPDEYLSGHIPHSINMALFSNDERAEVGTIYKQQGQYNAVLRGLDIVGPKMSELLSKAVEIAGKQRELLVHCWRGGSRSESMAWLFSNAGIKSYVLDGGYKAYRKYALQGLSEKRKILILGGYTGSGKTEILKILKGKGEQVIDLEGIANHRGSAFGALGQEMQPTSEHFANLLYDELRLLDPEKRLFLEDESHNIGSVIIPDEFFNHIRNSRVIALFSDVEVRLPRLVKEYGAFSKDELRLSVIKIKKKLGGLNSTRAIESIESGNIGEAVRIVLEYYDRAYLYGLAQRPEADVIRVETDTNDPQALAGKVRIKAGEIYQ